MNKEQTGRLYDVRIKLVTCLPAAGQLAILVVVALVLLLPAPFVPGQLPAARLNSDLMISHWPTALLIQRTFAQEHRLPLWNPYYAGGQPLAADPLAALFYPPTQLVHFLSLRHYYLVLIIGHLVFAGLGMLLLARCVLKLPSLAALVAAISFMATPRLLSHLGAGHITILQTVAWFPWLALTCWATVREPRRYGVLLGICLALALLAGHPQMAYYALLIVTGLAAWLLIKRWWLAGRKALLISAAGLAAAGVIAVLLAAVYLLPLLEFTSLSTRQLSVSSTDSYPLPTILYGLIDQQPTAILPWEHMFTPGLAVLALALFAVATRWRKAWPLLLVIALVAGFAMGNSSPFYLLALHVLPGFDRFHDPARIWFIALLAFALLAGLGTEALLRTIQRISFRAAMTAGLLAVFVVALSLIITDNGYAQNEDVRVTTTPSQLARTAARLAGSGRIYDMQGNIPQLDAVELQTPFANGWNPLLINSYVSYMERAGGYSSHDYLLFIPPFDSPRIQPIARLLGLMHVSIIVSRRPLNNPSFPQVGDVNGILIYKNTADAGSGYLVEPGPDGSPPSLDQLQRLDVDVDTVTQTPEQDSFTFSTGTQAYFVVAMPAFPGWVAELDGHPAPIQQIAGVLPAIKVAPGTHRLSYTYAPSSVYLGALLSTVGLLAALAWFLADRLKMIPLLLP